MKTNKEKQKAFMEKIAPMLETIHDICEEYGIDYVAHFETGLDQEGFVDANSSILVDKGHDLSMQLRYITSIIEDATAEMDANER